MSSARSELCMDFDGSLTTEPIGSSTATPASRTTAGDTTDKSSPERFNFSQLNLACPIDVEMIQNRWLNPFIATEELSVKHYPATVTRFIYRILKSYAAMAARGRATLPFIHPAQVQVPKPHLATCLNIARVSENPLPGSEDAAAAIIRREMDAVTATDQTQTDDLTALAAFQAYLIYTLVLFFRLKQGPSAFFRNAMTSLQDLACAVSRKGLVCTADASHARPRWEEWIVTEAKRRTLYVMYLLDNVLSNEESLPTYLGTELRGLPAPANKALWQAATRSAWVSEYNVFLTEWADNGLAIDELWPTPSELNEAGIVKRRARVDHWLENLDEFGTMIFTVTGCTHAS